MIASALDIGPAKAVKLGAMPSDEAAARDLFVRFRFAAKGGRPFCPHCECDAVYVFRCRDLFKCKACLRQFSPTSGTPWAYKKLTYWKLIFLVASFCKPANGMSAIELSDDAGLNYRTVLLWLHKFREQIALCNEALTLTGEVEMDGGWIGGYVRPKNVKKKRTDQRTTRFRADDRAMCVVVARQRNGPARTWVAKQEGHPRQQIKASVAADAVLYADQAPHWSWFRRSHKLYQVNHSVAYATPEACTNAAESLIRTLRSLEDTYCHIAQNYLDFYAAEAAWRAYLSQSRGRKADRFNSLMESMSNARRSTLAGYFQGKKRLCTIVDEDGKAGTWRPPTREEREAKRRQEGKSVHAGPYRGNRTSENWHQGFQFVTAAEFANNPSIVPDAPGVYLVLVADGGRALDHPDYRPEQGPPLWRRQDSDHLYTGEARGLRTRLREHLLGYSERSTLREAFLALHHAGSLGNEVSPTHDRDVTEAALTDWLSRNVTIGFKQSAYVRDYEADILRWTASPLNTQREKSSGFETTLRELRRGLRETVTWAWPTLSPTERHKPVRH